jgi:hypothetical protein
VLQRAETQRREPPKTLEARMVCLSTRSCEAEAGYHGKTPAPSAKANQGSALKREDERQCVDSDDERERRMYSVSALNSVTIRRSLSFSSLSSAMESAMFSTLLRSRCRTCGWQSEGGRLNFIALPTRLPLVFLRLHRVSTFVCPRQNQKLHVVATNRRILGQDDVRTERKLFSRCRIAAF